MIASEVSSNGLFVFKAGERVVANEVNENFEMLDRKLKKLELREAFGNHTWSCNGSKGAIESVMLNLNGALFDSGLFSERGVATKWTYDYSNHAIVFQTNPTTTLNVTTTIGDGPYPNTILRLTPREIELESFTCVIS